MASPAEAALARRCRSSSGSVGEDFPALGPGVFTKQIAHHGAVTVRRWLPGCRALAAVILVIAAGCSSSDGHSAAATSSSSSATTPTASSSSSTEATAVERVSIALTPIESSPSCDQATKEGTVDALLSAFRAARVRGSGAEHCLTARALGAYCTASHPCSRQSQFQASPGPICLYDCAGYKVKDVNFEVTRAADGGFSVYVGVQAQPSSPSATSPKGYPASAYESLTLGPGLRVGSPIRVPLVIVDATTSA